MDLLALTKSTTFIIGPISSVLGWIMNLLFDVCSMLGIYNIGLCIILFTLIVKILMFPLTIKQQKSTKLMAVINPEVQAIQKKYKDKKDQASMQKQQAEIQAVYSKYGTSATGGCLQMLIQMPIIFALYQVISKIPAYVDGVRVYFDNIVTGIQTQGGFINTIAGLAESKAMPIDKFDYNVGDKLVDLFYKFTVKDWSDLSGLFPDLTSLISENSDRIIKMNEFFTLNLMDSPGFRLSFALIIPILAGLTQWVSTKLMTANQDQAGSENPTANSMKTMNTMMPLMSAFFCVTMPIGIGLYWIASSFFQIIQQLIVNAYMSKIDIDDLIARNLEKQNKKREKKGLPPQTISKVATANAKRVKVGDDRIVESEALKKVKTEEKIKESNEYYSRTEDNPNSLAAKAKMVKRFNEKNSK